jgi:hypothetical protein
MTLSSITGLDHFVIRVPDLDRGEAALRRLGFFLTPRGFHAGRGSANHTVPLSDGNYFELLYFPPDQPSAFGGRNAVAEGPVAVALQTPDSRLVQSELKAAGYDVPLPRDLSRAVELPDGAHLARFLNTSFPKLKPAALSLFACQQLTRDLVWRPEWQVHPNGALGVTELTLVHPEPVELHATYAALFPKVALPHDEEMVIPLGRTTLRILSPRGFASRNPGIALPPVLEAGWFAGATIRVASRARLLDLLASAGITPIAPPDGRVIIHQADAAGTVLTFIEEAGE